MSWRHNDDDDDDDDDDDVDDDDDYDDDDDNDDHNQAPALALLGCFFLLDRWRSWSLVCLGSEQSDEAWSITW